MNELNNKSSSSNKRITASLTTSWSCYSLSECIVVARDILVVVCRPIATREECPPTLLSPILLLSIPIHVAYSLITSHRYTSTRLLIKTLCYTLEHL
jgi:hypothetical protein